MAGHLTKGLEVKTQVIIRSREKTQVIIPINYSYNRHNATNNLCFFPKDSHLRYF